jgi:hypothetical protein
LTTHQSTIRIIRIDRIHESGIKWVCQNILPADRLNNTVTYTFNTSSKCSEVKLLLSTSLLNKLEDGENPRVKFNDIVWHLVSATASDFGDEHVHEDEDAFDWVSRVCYCNLRLKTILLQSSYIFIIRIRVLQYKCPQFLGTHILPTVRPNRPAAF